MLQALSWKDVLSTKQQGKIAENYISIISIQIFYDSLYPKWQIGLNVLKANRL